MSPGSMPSLPRAVGARRQFNYRGHRLRSHRLDAPVVFGTTELPRAAVHSSVGAFHRWAAEQLAWLRPRAIPGIVALFALVGLLAVTQHLQDLAHGGNVIATTPVIDAPITN